MRRQGVEEARDEEARSREGKELSRSSYSRTAGGAGYERARPPFDRYLLVSSPGKVGSKELRRSARGGGGKEAARGTAVWAQDEREKGNSKLYEHASAS